MFFTSCSWCLSRQAKLSPYQQLLPPVGRPGESRGSGRAPRDDGMEVGLGRTRVCCQTAPCQNLERGAFLSRFGIWNTSFLQRENRSCNSQWLGFLGMSSFSYSFWLQFLTNGAAFLKYIDFFWGEGFFWGPSVLLEKLLVTFKN